MDGKKVINVVLAIVALLAASIFVQGFIQPPKADFPKTDAQAVWKYITETSPYTVLSDGEWHYLPGWEGRKEGQSPHGAGIVTYVNHVAYESVQKKQDELPEHAIVVKENYAPAQEGNKQSALWPNAKLAAVTVMYKVKGYNPEANDWYWVKYGPDGSVDMMKNMKIAGKVQSCIGCHASTGGADNDYLIGYNLEQMKPAR